MINELEEKVLMQEELIQAFLKRMDNIEKEVPEFLKAFVNQYRETLEKIAERIDAANTRYDDSKIQQQIDAVSKLVATVPKVIAVKNHHHFGVWSKSLIIGVVTCFVVTAISIGTALYLNHLNDRLNNEAYKFWLVRALYPEVSKTIETKLAKDARGFIEAAEKAMVKQQAIIAAESELEKAGKSQKAAERKLQDVKSGR